MAKSRTTRERWLKWYHSLSPEKKEEYKVQQRKWSRKNYEKKKNDPEYREKNKARSRKYYQTIVSPRREQGICIECGKAPVVKGMKYCQSCREKRNKRAKLRGTRWYHSRRKQALEIINDGEAKCVRCGCDDIKLLQINHKNGGGRNELTQKGAFNFYSAIIDGKRSCEDLEVTCLVCNVAHYGEKKGGLWKIEWIKSVRLEGYLEGLK